MSISVSTQWQDGVATIRVGGELDLATGEPLAQEIHRAINGAGTRAIRVDLSQMQFIDSSGIAVLLKGRRAADRTGVAYHITGAAGMVHHILSLTGVLEHLSAEPPVDSRR